LKRITRHSSVTAAFLAFAATTATAQTAPLPGDARGDRTGLLTRAAFFLSLAGMETEDPRFSVVQRSRADVDFADYGRGRINFLFDGELVMGSERRTFDLNQANVIFEASASVRIATVEVAGVVHHVSRHVVDRAFDRVPAWHTIGVRGTRVFSAPRSALAVTLEYGHVVQHTFVDYTSIGQATIRFDERLGGVAHVFAMGAGEIVGVDSSVSNRDRQTGARLEGGVHLPSPHAAADFYAAWERRVDGYPTSRQPSSWLEFGFRLGTP
jgi:hypothetical protein